METGITVQNAVALPFCAILAVSRPSSIRGVNRGYSEDQFSGLSKFS